jgi:hypothetical protein
MRLQSTDRAPAMKDRFLAPARKKPDHEGGGAREDQELAKPLGRPISALERTKKIPAGGGEESKIE